MTDPRSLPTRRAMLQAAFGLAALASGCDRLPESLQLSGSSKNVAPPSPHAGNFLTLLCGPADGEHVVIAGHIAQEINATGRLGPRVGVRASIGSAYNMRAVSAGLAPLGLAQSQILLGSADEPPAAIASLRGRLRLIGQLNEVASTLLVLPDRGVSQLADLSGRRVAVLQPGQTPFGTLKLLGAAVGLRVEAADVAKEGTIAVVALTLPEVEAALNAGTIDGFFISASHPSALVYRLLGRTPARLCPVVISPDRLAATSSAYVATTISAGLYPATAGDVDVPTVSSRNVLFTVDSTPTPLVRALTEALWSAVDSLKAYPLLSGMSWAGLAYGVDPTTLHPGALAWYQEQGLVERDVVAAAFAHQQAGVTAADMDDPVALNAAAALGGATAASRASLADLINGVSSGRYDIGVVSEDGLARLRAMSPDELEPITARNVLLADQLPGPPLQLVGRGPPPIRGRRGPPPAPGRLADLAGRPVGVSDDHAARALTRLGVVFTKKKLAPPLAITLAPEALAEALRSGQIDGFLALESPPIAPVAAALDQKVGGVLIELDEEERAALAEAGWTLDELVDSTYVGQGAVKTVSARAHVLLAESSQAAGEAASAQPLWSALGVGRPALAAPLCIGGGAADTPSFRVAAAIARSYAVASGDGVAPGPAAGAPSEVVAMPTGTAEDTARALRDGELGFAIVAASALVESAAEASAAEASAAEASADGASAKANGVRSVCTLYTRALTALVTSPTYLARVNSFVPSGNAALRVRTTESAPEIQDLSELGGHRVSIRQDLKPTPRTNGLTIFNLQRFLSEQWVLAVQSPEPLPEVAIDLFVQGKIDALFWMTEHPSMEVDLLIHACDGAHILPITGIDDASARVPSAQSALIDVAPYQNLPAPSLIPTVGIPVLLVATEATPEVTVEAVLRSIAAGIDLLRQDVPVLHRLNKDTLKPGARIELHPAAERFFSR